MEGSCRRSQGGFTLAEVLGAVAVLIVLFALLVPALSNLQRDLRQKDLDSKAEIMFLAAQNKLSAMRSSGYADVYQNTSEGSLLTELPGTPCDREIELDELGQEKPMPKLYAMNAKDRGTEGSVCSLVMTDDVAEDGLMSHYWIVEYAPDSGSVYDDPDHGLLIF